MTCAKCNNDAPQLTWGGKAKKTYGGGVCDTCVKEGALK